MICDSTDCLRPMRCTYREKRRCKQEGKRDESRASRRAWPSCVLQGGLGGLGGLAVWMKRMVVRGGQSVSASRRGCAKYGLQVPLSTTSYAARHLQHESLAGSPPKCVLAGTTGSSFEKLSQTTARNVGVCVEDVCLSGECRSERGLTGDGVHGATQSGNTHEYTLSSPALHGVWLPVAVCCVLREKASR